MGVAYGFFKLELHRTEIIIRGVGAAALSAVTLAVPGLQHKDTVGESVALQPSYHIPPRDSSPAQWSQTSTEATKQDKIQDLLDQLENARHSEMKKDDFMKIRKLSTVDPSRIYGMDMENVSDVSVRVATAPSHLRAPCTAAAAMDGVAKAAHQRAKEKER
ncbi:hypothetical protein AK812_SmicGene17246 [Symbiodinium microadriaticum]|uniref:Uncharacterized protein n=1 Tax=Symbiodinium microadriaticum TaxID=2951 RepID=A0A1Q9DY54_SYMMI|nr:hypothetical protein AK812_SmicGene17246 [Symbiodinium microadriaticum]